MNTDNVTFDGEQFGLRNHVKILHDKNNQQLFMLWARPVDVDTTTLLIGRGTAQD